MFSMHLNWMLNEWASCLYLEKCSYKVFFGSDIFYSRLQTVLYRKYSVMGIEMLLAAKDIFSVAFVLFI